MKGPAVGGLEAVIFDFGGVITKPDRVRAELCDYDRHLGLPEGRIMQCTTSGADWEAVSRGEISEDDYWVRVAAPFVDRLPPAFGRFKHSPLPYEELNADVVAVVRALHGQIKLGLLSNATVSLGDVLERAAWLRNLFDDVVISAQVGMRKPDARLYELAARRLGTTMERALLVDDKVRNTAAAREAGMQAITYASPRQLRVDLRELGLQV